MRTHLPIPQRGTAPKFTACLLWPSGWMDQDATWQGGRPRPWPHCVRWRPSSLSPKGAQPPIFGPCLLWPNRWMDQDATWQEVGVGPGHIVLDGDATPPPPNGHEPRPQFSAHVCCGQAAGWIKMPLGREVYRPIVSDGDPAPPPSNGHNLSFSAHVCCGQTAAWIKMSLGLG